MTIHHEGKNVICYRNREKISSSLSEISLFLEADVSVNPSIDGSFQVSSYDTNTWFVPMQLGAWPVRLRSGKCIRLICQRADNHTYDCPPCEMMDLFDRLTALGGMDALCAKAYMISTSPVDCDSFLPYDYFGGGVIVNAQRVETIDPEWFVPSPDAHVRYMIDDNGNLIKLQDKKD